MHRLVVVLLVCWVVSLQAAEVRLRWEPSDAPDVIGYRIYQGSESSIYNVVRDVGAVTETVISELIPGETYYWTATAYTAAGVESLYSNEVQWTIPKEPDTTLPVVAITYPIHESVVKRKSTIFIAGYVKESWIIETVEVFVNGQSICVMHTQIFECGWKIPAAGGGRVYAIQAQVFDTSGHNAISTPIVVTAR